MFTSVLIANRGEIACRIARTAKRLGMRTVAVYSDADAGARHVRLCDEACPIGPAPPAQSYLSITAIIDAARASGVECVHPGYGFLAENAEFAEACKAAGLVFVGPPASAIRAMGLKDRAKALMQKAEVPIVPGYHGDRQEPKFLKEKAYEIGYPLLIKPVAGGGGKGMRKVERHAEFDAALESAMREAQSAFGNPQVLLEHYVAAPRHIELQIFADTQGHVIHLNERDCSLQRRHQKLVEETPAPGMTSELRAVMGAAAIKAAQAVGYLGAGTVEFIVEGGKALHPDGFWFMEMNTRLQVEHPVTEATTGLDLVEWQFRVAAGEPLSLQQEDVPLNGHAIEARIYAEDPGRGFLPSTGKVVAWDVPQGEGIRVDSGIDAGDTVSSFYDPMIAKVIAHGKDREAALQRLTVALGRTVAAGPRTNIAFLLALCGTKEFRRGGVSTDFIDRNLATVVDKPGPDHAAAALGVERLIAREQGRLAASRARGAAALASPWDAMDGFQLSGKRAVLLRVMVDGTPVTATATFSSGVVAVTMDGAVASTDASVVETADAIYVLRQGRQTVVRWADLAETDVADLGGDGVVRAPMHGKILALLVGEGAAVHKGQRLALIEAMKMEHVLLAPIDGTVAEVAASSGAQVAEGALVLRIAAPGGKES